MYKLNLKHSFCAAHQLTNAYSKECNENLHGHNWDVLVEIKTKELQNNMVIDFKKIKELINELDHKNLNKLLNFEPTAENIAKYIHNKIDNLGCFNKLKVTIWEAKNASITYE